MSDDRENILLGVEHALAGRWDDANAELKALKAVLSD